MVRVVLVICLLFGCGALFYIAWLSIEAGDGHASFFLMAALSLALPLVPLLMKFGRQTEQNADSLTPIRFVPHTDFLKILFLIVLGILFAVVLNL